jgi:nicotinate-nucleotide adenylyltransferase
LSQARRIGLFGGAFDPPHQAHVALARAGLAQLQLDELRIIPTGQAWHKSRSLSPAADRLAMVKLAFADLAGVLIDERELNRRGASYTIDTVLALRAEQGKADFFLLMGADQWAAFTGWHRWQELASLVHLCVARRPDLADAPEAGTLEVTWLDLPPMPVSATGIRGQVAAAPAGGSWADLVPPAVARYISDHRLYAQP